MQKALQPVKTADYVIAERTGVFSKIKPFLIGLLCGGVVTVLITVIFSLFMSFFDIPDSLIPFFAYIGVCVGAIITGFVTVTLRKSKGLFNGAVSGLLFFLIQTLIGVILNGELSFETAFFAFLIIDLVLASVGGVVSVNLRK